MLHLSPRLVENPVPPVDAPRPTGQSRSILPACWLAGVLGFNLLLSIPVRAETSTAEPTVILHGNPQKTSLDSPGPASAMPGQVAPTPNALILEAVAAMPSGGSYRANSTAISALCRSVQVRNSRLLIDPTQATPSFCSCATYLVFLTVLDNLQRAGRIPLDEVTLSALLVQDPQPDGAGVWGRWNANGPGTARLFFETGLGRNFTSFDAAQPGDFLKIFWNDEIGARESGHSVVYLGIVKRPEGEFVRYWSSNIPRGFGLAEVPRQRIRRAVFSRLEHPEFIRRAASLEGRDAYLAAMLKRSSTGEELAQMVGLHDSLPGSVNKWPAAFQANRYLPPASRTDPFSLH